MHLLNSFQKTTFRFLLLLLLIFSASLFSQLSLATTKTTAIGTWQLTIDVPSGVQFFGVEDIQLSIRQQGDSLLADWQWGRSVRDTPVQIINNEIVIRKETSIIVNGERQESYTVMTGRVDDDQWRGSIQFGDDRISALNGVRLRD